MSAVRTEAVALTVVYDDTCPLCQRCRAWIAGSVQLVPVGFVAASDVESVSRLGLPPATVPVGDELVVVGHIGPGQPAAVWVGPDAFITCLWALRDHRTLAGRLQRPTMRPVAKAAFHALSAGRGSISKLLGGETAPDPVGCFEANCQPAVQQ